MSAPRRKGFGGVASAGRAESRFVRHLLAEWRRLALPARGGGERVVVAVSGGADSVALLLALDDLVKSGRLDLSLTAAHLNHALRGESGAADACWVAELARSLEIEVDDALVDVKERAARAGDNLEQAARRARYEFLLEAARRRGAQIVLTAHTLDDQAETVLLRLLRGSGAEGLGAMEASRALDEESGVRLVRPLLGWARRAETEEYCRWRGVEFRADSMNEDESYARVRVRRRLLPLLETFNPNVVEALARSAELLREDASLLHTEAEELLAAATEQAEATAATEAENVQRPSGGRQTSTAAALRVNILRRAPAALRRRALRLWLGRCRGDLRRLELVHLKGVERLLEGERGGRIAELPGGGFVERRRGRLRFHLKESPQRRRGTEAKPEE